MTADGVFRSLEGRLRSRGYWAAVVLVSGLFLLADVPGWGSLWQPRALAQRVLIPLCYNGAFVWLAPMPWQWSGETDRPPGFLRGAVQALVFLSGLLAVLVGLYHGTRVLAGVPVPYLVLLKGNVQALLPSMLVVGGVIARQERAREEKGQAEDAARAAQTRLLQSQLHPHVLFNALNGLAELTHEDPARARRSLRALADLLRRLLWASEQATFPLREERRMVEDYLAIESMRLEARLQVAWEWEEGLDDLPVLPLLLQPLVENAIKHGVAPHKRGGRVVLGARRDGEGLRLFVLNTGAPLAPIPGGGESGGIGVKNLRARLRMAYGPASSLELSAEGACTRAEARIPLPSLP